MRVALSLFCSLHFRTLEINYSSIKEEVQSREKAHHVFVAFFNKHDPSCSCLLPIATLFKTSPRSNSPAGKPLRHGLARQPPYTEPPQPRGLKSPQLLAGRGTPTRS